MAVCAALPFGCSSGNTTDGPALGTGAIGGSVGGTAGSGSPAIAGTAPANGGGGSAGGPLDAGGASSGSNAGGSGGSPTSAGAAGSASAGRPGSTGGVSASAGAGGASTIAGTGGTSIVGGAPSAAGSNAGGASAGGKACHSTEDWTPRAGDLWISPSGADTNPGTEASPKKGLSAAISAWSSGKTIWVRAGTYAHGAPIRIATSATAAGPLRISGVVGEAKPRIDFSSEPRATNNNGVRGIEISGSYVHLRYLEIANASDNCVYVTGSNNVLEWLAVHDCQDTGVQLSNGAANNRVLNVDSYANADPTGENADGFAPKLSIGAGNYFCGTRAYHNADDGYDCWAAGDASPVTFEYCWALGQPGPKATAQSDGNGFKLGSPASRAAGGNAAHKLVDCFAFHNRSAGFTANGNSSGKITCTNCGTWGNGTAWSPGTGGVLPQHTGDITNLAVSVQAAMTAARDAKGNLPDIASLAR